MALPYRNELVLVATDQGEPRLVYYTGTGQELSSLHPEEACSGRSCVIHNPSNHIMLDWPTHFRLDKGQMERLCRHGVGHPDPDDLAWHISRGREWMGIHGCCGCCHG